MLVGEDARHPAVAQADAFQQQQQRQRHMAVAAVAVPLVADQGYGRGGDETTGWDNVRMNRRRLCDGRWLGMWAGPVGRRE